MRCAGLRPISTDACAHVSAALSAVAGAQVPEESVQEAPRLRCSKLDCWERRDVKVFSYLAPPSQNRVPPVQYCPPCEFQKYQLTAQGTSGRKS